MELSNYQVENDGKIYMAAEERWPYTFLYVIWQEDDYEDFWKLKVAYDDERGLNNGML